MGLTGLFAVVGGFATTFIIPVATGSFKAPLFIYVHGLLAFMWVCLFIIQVSLIHRRNYRLHMRTGIVALVIALGIVLTMLPVGNYAVQKELGQGLGATAISGIVGVVTSGLLFLSLVIAGLMNRKRPSSHKRLMLLANIALLWPAWFRFRHYFPAIPNPEIWFAVVLADSLIVIAWIRDKKVSGRIHPVLLYIGGLIIAEHIFEVLAFDSKGWREVAGFIYSRYNSI